MALYANLISERALFFLYRDQNEFKSHLPIQKDEKIWPKRSSDVN